MSTYVPAYIQTDGQTDGQDTMHAYKRIVKVYVPRKGDALGQTSRQLFHCFTSTSHEEARGEEKKAVLQFAGHPVDSLLSTTMGSSVWLRV